MPQPLARRLENWRFSHAAAAMGAHWEKARKIEARRVERIRSRLLAGARTLAGAPAVSQAGAASQN